MINNAWVGVFTWLFSIGIYVGLLVVGYNCINKFGWKPKGN